MAAYIHLKKIAARNVSISTQLLRLNLNVIANQISRQVSQVQTQEDKVIIPKKITRGPTDILEALASTVPKSMGPLYKYQDDPYFLPASNLSKRGYALALESGKKAARYMLDKFPEHFSHDPAVPLISAFNPKTKYSKDSDVTEDHLKHCIENLDVENSMTIYTNLQDKSSTLSVETQQNLLELLCFTNCEPLPQAEYFEERWYKYTQKHDIRIKWKENGLADEIFKIMEDKGSVEYCSMIKGLSKYLSANRAYNLYDEALEKKIPLTKDVYSSLMRCVPYLRESSDTRWQLVESLLQNMVENELVPDLATFNSVLDVIARFGMWPKAKILALQTLTEMKSLNVEPSLATYYFILITFCKERGPVSFILKDILKELQGKEFTIKHPRDVDFFVTAMDVCDYHLSDLELAYRVHELYMHGNNSKLIGDSFKESIYYQHFVKLLCNYEDIDVFFKFYETYVPSVYTPEPSVMLEIIRTIELAGKYDYLPRIWSDLITFEMSFRENLVQEILSALAKSSCHVGAELKEQYAIIASDIRSRIDGQDLTKMRVRLTWNREMLGNCIEVFTNADKLEEAFEVLKFMDQQQSIGGQPRPESLIAFCKTSLENGKPELAIECLKFSIELSIVQVLEYMQGSGEKFQYNKEQKEELDAILNSLQVDTKSKLLEE